MAREPGGWRGKRGSTTERGFGWAWQKLRARVLERDGYVCQPCAARGRPTVATQVDHRVPKAKGGTDDEANLQAICEPCHKVKTLADEGIVLRPVVGLDGWPEGS